MSALSELRKRARTPANTANPANMGGIWAVDSQDSQDSQGVTVETGKAGTPAEALKAERLRLLELAAAEVIDAAHVHRLQDADLADCLGLDDHQRSIFLRMLVDTADRHAGRVPLDDTAAMFCKGCGPVWTHPDIAAVLPVVDGWPRALGCPWCFVRKAGLYIPRPMVACENCVHYRPDAINPPTGMGDCGNGHGMHYPMQKHRCGSFQPSVTP